MCSFPVFGKSSVSLHPRMDCPLEWDIHTYVCRLSGIVNHTLEIFQCCSSTLFSTDVDGFSDFS